MAKWHQISLTPHLDYAQECFRNAQIVQPEHWKDNWMKSMWLHLMWAAEGREIAVACGVMAVPAFRPCSFCKTEDACRDRGCADAAIGREIAARGELGGPLPLPLGVKAGCTYPDCKCSGPAPDSGCGDPRAYTDAIGQAGEDYLKQFPHAHPLPAQWRWSELWDRMNAVAAGVPVVDPTDPGHDVEVLREHVRHLERRIRELHAERNAGVTAAPEPATPKPMQGLADWLRAVAETQAADTEQEACMRQWAREVDAACGVMAVHPSERAEAIYSKVDYLVRHTADHWQRDWKGDHLARAANAIELDRLQDEIRADINAACGVRACDGSRP